LSVLVLVLVRPDRDDCAAPAAAWPLCAMMAAVTVPVSSFVAWNELRSFLRIGSVGDRRRRATPSAARWRKELAGLLARMRTLKMENGRLAGEVDGLRQCASRYAAAPSRLRTVVAESSRSLLDADDEVALVRENEATPDSIVDNVRLDVITDVAGIIVGAIMDDDDDGRCGGGSRGCSRRRIIDAAWADRVTGKVKAKIWRDRSVVLDERNFVRGDIVGGERRRRRRRRHDNGRSRCHPPAVR
jgi:hypothetical protein